MAPPSDAFRLLEIPPEVRNLVLQKMDANRFIPMYKTCSSMASSVDSCLKSMKYNTLIYHLSSLSMQRNAVFVTVTGNCSIKLPTSTFDSFIWRFITCDNVNMEDDSSATNYLAKLRDYDYSVEYLWTKKCNSSVIANAMRILKPVKTQIKSCRGPISDILPALPFSTWRKTGRGSVIYPNTDVVMNNILLHLADFEVLKRAAIEPEKVLGLKDLRTRRYVVLLCERSVITYVDYCSEEDDQRVEEFCNIYYWA